MKKRVFSFVLILCMLAGIVPSVYARYPASSSYWGTQPDNDITDGQCGDNLWWHYDGDTKELTISGWGDMYDYKYLHTAGSNEGYVPAETYTTIPWFYKEINRVNLPDGLTSIGKYAFYDLSCFINIPKTVTRIGYDAFSWGTLYLNDGFQSLPEGLNGSMYTKNTWDYENFDEGCLIICGNNDNIYNELQKTFALPSEIRYWSRYDRENLDFFSDPNAPVSYCDMICSILNIYGASHPLDNKAIPFIDCDDVVYDVRCRLYDAIKEGILVPDDYYNNELMPTRTVMRRDAAVLLTRYLGYVNEVKSFKADPNNKPFKDWDETEEWLRGYLAVLEKHGIMYGTEDGRADMSRPITVREFAMLLQRALDDTIGRITNANDRTYSYKYNNRKCFIENGILYVMMKDILSDEIVSSIRYDGDNQCMSYEVENDSRRKAKYSFAVTAGDTKTQITGYNYFEEGILQWQEEKTFDINFKYPTKLFLSNWDLAVPIYDTNTGEELFKTDGFEIKVTKETVNGKDIYDSEIICDEIKDGTTEMLYSEWKNAQAEKNIQ